MMLRVLLHVFAVAVVLLASPTPGHAQAANGAAKTSSQNGRRELSPYEKETLRRALAISGYEIDRNPEGKWIESIEVVPFEVFEDRDWMPTDVLGTGINLAKFSNWWHFVTRPYVIEREVLLRPGTKFDWALLKESERNLRVRQLSVVLIAAVKGSESNRVRLLVATKDVWSLRVNFEPRFVNGKIDFLTLQPAEENVFGMHKMLVAPMTLTRATYSFGLGYIDPRVAGSRLRATISANVIFNCQTKDLEGASGGVTYGKPLYSTRTQKWGWNTSVSFLNSVARPAGVSGNTICSGGQSALLDFAATPDVDAVPYEYRQDILSASYVGIRSFGVDYKNDLTFGMEATRRAFQPRRLDELTPQIQREFFSLMPTSDTRISPFVQLRSWRNRWHRVSDFETLGLQEDYSLGYDIWFRVYPALQAAGSTRNILGVRNGLGYTFPLGSGLWRLFASHRAELSALDQSDAQVRAGTRLATPRFVVGRLHLDGLVTHRYINYLNPQSSLGGTSRLRGYRLGAFVGPDLVVANLEFRSRPVSLWGAQLAAVAFWDSGDAFRGFSNFELKHGYGGGIRFVLPQVERNVFRVDVAAPLDPDTPEGEFSVVAQFRQAFGMPSAAP